MNKLKSIVMFTLILALSLGSTLTVHAGLFDLFAKPLDAPSSIDAHNCEWDGDDFYVVWSKVPDAGEYSIKIDNKEYKSSKNYIKITPASSQIANGSVNGKIEVSAVPAATDKKHKRSGYSTINYSGTILDKPVKYTCYWDGDKICVEFSRIQGAAQYEIVGKYGSDFISAPRFYYTPTDDAYNSGLVDATFRVRAIPDTNDRSVRSSDLAGLSISEAAVNYSFATDEFSAVNLSLSNLEKYFIQYGYTPTTISDGDYTIVDISITDNKNKTTVLGTFGRTALSAAAGALGNILDNSDEILEYGYENNGDFKTARNAAGFFGAVGGVIKDKDIIFKDTNIHYKYFYKRGEENYSAAYMLNSYMISNNQKPTFSDSAYNSDDNCYYFDCEWFKRRIKVSSEKSKDRWNIYVEPAGYYQIYNCF